MDRHPALCHKDATQAVISASLRPLTTAAPPPTIGTGNIIGVGTAIALGGPGAVLWCWLTGVFGIATKYGRSLIAVKYRVRTQGRHHAGRRHVCPGTRTEHESGAGIVFAVLGALPPLGLDAASRSALASPSIVNSNVKPLLRSSSLKVCLIHIHGSSAAFSGPYLWGYLPGYLRRVKSITQGCAKTGAFHGIFLCCGMYFHPLP